MRKTNTIGTGTIVQEKGEMNVFKKSKRLIPLFMAAMMLTTAIGASAQELPKDPDWESKIDQELKAAMEKADKGEKIPVAVWLRDETVLETVDRRLKEEKNLDPEVFEDQEKFQTEVVDKVTEKLEAQLGVEEANKKKLPTIATKDARTMELLNAENLDISKLSDRDIQRLEFKNKGQSPIDKTVAAKSKEFTMEKRKLNQEEFVKNSDNVFTTHGIQPEELTVQSKLTSLNIVSLQKEQIKALAEDMQVESLNLYKRPNYTIQAEKSEAPMSSTETESKKTGSSYVRDILGYSGAGVSIGVLELGEFISDNPMVDKAVANGRLKYVRNYESDIYDPENPYYPVINGVYQMPLWNQHATNVTSLIVGNEYLHKETDGTYMPYQGVVPDATVYQTSIRCDDNIISGVELLIKDCNVSIINMSLGSISPTGYSTEDQYIDEVSRNNHVVCVVSAGNESEGAAKPGKIASPGLAKNAITVANANTMGDDSDNYDFLHSSSSFDALYKPELSAPGCMRFISDNQSYTDYGTSFAAPIVAGIAAQVIQEIGKSSFPDTTRVKSTLLTACDFSQIVGSPIIGSTPEDKMTGGYTYKGMPYFREASGAGMIDAKMAFDTATRHWYAPVSLSGKYAAYTKKFTIPWGGKLRCTYVSMYTSQRGVSNDIEMYIKDAKTGKIIASSISYNTVQVLEYYNPSASIDVTVEVKFPLISSDLTNNFKSSGTFTWWQ